jgi:hypothetical protein
MWRRIMISLVLTIIEKYIIPKLRTKQEKRGINNAKKIIQNIRHY